MSNNNMRKVSFLKFNVLREVKQASRLTQWAPALVLPSLSDPAQIRRRQTSCLNPKERRHARLQKHTRFKSPTRVIHCLESRFISTKPGTFISPRWSWIPPCLFFFFFPEGVLTSPHAGETFTSSPEQKGRRGCAAKWIRSRAPQTRKLRLPRRDARHRSQVESMGGVL